MKLLSYSELTELVMQKYAAHIGVSRDCYPIRPHTESEIMCDLLQNGESEPPVNGCSVTRFDISSRDAAVLGFYCVREYSISPAEDDGDFEILGYDVE